MQATEIFNTASGRFARTAGGFFRLRDFSFDTLFQSPDPAAHLEAALGDAMPAEESSALAGDVLLPPVESQEIWAAGVTYFRSRSARMEEAEQAGGDIFYDKVYEAERPELFFKATPARARGHRAPVCIRPDSSWDVPEPELTLAIGANGRVFGYTIGNDMSSRSIEGENPLYLPQAKVYDGSCALGPALVVRDPLDSGTRIRLEIDREGQAAFSGETDTGQIKRGFDELAGWLYRSNSFPHGALLMTGTGVVPDSDFTLKPGDVVRIRIDGLGELENPVELA
ncbi:MAG: fumarylacetoacetate hydrolase family protein [Verrucomicrobiae bacterium]|nr:fumarylacetoacetate hydrolase family protein [Verrucomicrobiae bacterium]MCP5541489.1 fumarylacetoacetate hydrolase family protein [Akkermansiaceae bacterium]MCP5550338.1 fumarylacetoacetate hydrolase family protein [Akkermansiaceae bacterium]